MGREIPLALVALVVLQTAGGVWWLSGVSSKLDNAVASIVEFKADRYTREDARRDRELMEQKLEAKDLAQKELERRVTGNESRIDRIERKP